MKKIEAIIKPEKVRTVLDALKNIGVRGVTVISEKGQGSAARQEVRGARGMPLFTAEYNQMNSVITIADDSMVETILSTIAKAVSDSSKGDGKIFVFPADDAMDLASGRRGSSAL